MMHKDWLQFKPHHGKQRRRWLKRVIVLTTVLGILAALAVTAVFAGYSYFNVRSDLQKRAGRTAAFFSEKSKLEFEDFYQSCVDYARTYPYVDGIILEFINPDGVVVSSSSGGFAALSPDAANASVVDTGGGRAAYQPALLGGADIAFAVDDRRGQ